MKGGYMGKLLFVDLSKNSIEEKELTEDMAKKFLGGYGIGARVLYDMVPADADPMGPDNVIGFVTGPLTGTGAFFSGRYVVVCKSPITNAWNDANSGGFFGPELKKAGFDGVFVQGAAQKPVYLWIQNGKAEIRDASKLWGLDATETQEALVKETGEPKLRAALIGPSGEKLSKLACVMNDGHRAAGRGGVGTVMGSKKLKAVAVQGDMKVPVADPEKLKAVNRTISAAMKDGPTKDMMAGFGEYGTGVGNAASALNGDSPVKNWGGIGVVDFGEEKANALAVPMFDGKYKTKKYACANCPLGCGAHYEVNEGPWPIGKTDRPEYETWAAFGSLCLNGNPESIMKCNEICNRMGVDTIATGATIAWAMECYENGVLTKEEMDGIELTWGNAEAIVQTMEAIAAGKGIGAVLALGSQGAADKLGKGHQFLQTVKGIELPMHDPKLAPGFARTYQFNPTPARHVQGGLGLIQSGDPSPGKYEYSTTGFLDLALVSNIEVLNAAGLCLFGMFAGVNDATMKSIEAVTGWNFKNQDNRNVAVRIQSMRQAFNLKHGQKPEDLKIPPRAVGKPPQEEGPVEGITVDNERLAQNFFNYIGWDEKTGKPHKGLLEKLGGMDDVIQDLYG